MLDLNITLPEGFLEEEERCGYTISADMKKIWAVQLDLLNEILRVCKKHDIKIFASGGTLLGAIRHKGYIPWDDDIDLDMLREDYDKLLAVAPAEFRDPYFFQTEETDEGSFRGHAQLRNSRTTAILKSEKGNRFFNQGIFIDIFPYDNLPDDPKVRKIFLDEYTSVKKKYKFYKRYTYDFKLSKKDTIVKNIMKKSFHTLFNIANKDFRIVSKQYEKVEKLKTRYNDTPTKQVVDLVFYSLERPEYGVFERTFYTQDIQEVDFEFMKIPISKDYDRILKIWYGDYSKFVIGTSAHGDVIFNVDQSYKEYLKMY